MGKVKRVVPLAVLAFVMPGHSGVLVGEEIMVEKIAPLGDPIEITVKKRAIARGVIPPGNANNLVGEIGWWRVSSTEG